jgi:cardiolipin synthase
MLAWAFLIHLCLAVALSHHILLNKRDPRGAGLWLFVIWIMPLAGLLLYWLLGVNRVARAARRRHLPWASGNLSQARPHSLPSSLLPLRHASDSLSPYPLCSGNLVSPLINGAQAYPAMLKAIHEARATLALSSFIFDQDAAGTAFTQALIQAAQRGVKVRVLVDGIGAWGPGEKLLRSVSLCGGRVHSFWPRGRWMRHPGLNLRNHRKIMVVDGRTAFTGGINISARHLGHGPHNAQARDIHFLVKGPAVSHLMDVFARDWRSSTHEILQGKDWFPALKSAGNDGVRGVPSGPDENLERIYELLLAGLRCARSQVRLMTPYFLPDRPILTALRSACRSGVRVQVIIPRHSDHPFMRWGCRGYLWELVETGVEVREAQGGFIHSKIMTVDKAWSMVGSANLDPRSFRLNFEFNIEVASKALSKQLDGYMDSICERSFAVTLQDLRREPMAARLRNQAVKLFSPYL